MSALWTKSWKRTSPFNAVQKKGNGGVFYMDQYSLREVSLLWGNDGQWLNITMVLAKLYPKLWSHIEPLNFLTFVGTNYCELKPFLEMAL